MYNWKDKTDEQKVKLITASQLRLERMRQVYEDLWSIIIKIFRPRRYDILGLRKKGEQFGADVYDQGPANALSKFSGGRVGYMVNRAVPWIQFTALDDSLMQLDHIKEYMQDAAVQVLFAAGRSTFYTSVVPHSMDADSVGTSVMIPLEDVKKDRIVFDVAHPRDSYIGVDQFGDAHIYHRSPLILTRLSAEQMFSSDRLPDIWFDENKQLKDALQEDHYIWAVYPNDDRIEDSEAEEEQPFKVFVILRGDNQNNKDSLVYEHGRNHFPVCYRTGRESGAQYGTSIASDCLTAALVSNKLGEKSVTAAHLAVEPVKIAPKSLRATMGNSLDPGSTIWTDQSNEGVKLLMDRLNWPITDAQMKRLDEQIQDKMFIRFFEMLSAGDIKVRTAFEVSQMMAEKATLMSTIIDSFEQECLAPAIDILIIQETLAGRMPDVPPEIADTGGIVDIRYLGPLAQLQRSLLRSKGTIDALGIIKEMMEINEQVAWKFDWLGLAEDVAVAQGMPQKHVLSDAEVDIIRQENEERQQLQEQALLLESAGKAAPGLGQAPEAGSPASAVADELEAA